MIYSTQNYKLPLNQSPKRLNNQKNINQQSLFNKRKNNPTWMITRFSSAISSAMFKRNKSLITLRHSEPSKASVFAAPKSTANSEKSLRSTEQSLKNSYQMPVLTVISSTKIRNPLRRPFKEPTRPNSMDKLSEWIRSKRRWIITLQSLLVICLLR